MLGLKLNRHSIRRAYNNSKRYLGNAYHHTKGQLGDIDSGVGTAKQIYSIAQPLISSLMNQKDFEKGNTHVIKALSGYEDIRNTVMDTHETAQNHYNNIIGDLKKKNIDIGL